MFTSVNVLKDHFHKQTTVSLTVYNPFTKFNNYWSDTKTPDFAQSTFNQYYYRQIRLAVNYKFGHLNGELKTNHPRIENEDVPSVKSTENQRVESALVSYF
jgi:hypothetical protein